MWMIIPATYVIMSVLTFIAYWRDKRAATRGGWRTPESTLHLLELLGGWPGALLGQGLLRHKSSKTSYRLTLWAIIILHAGAWITWLWWQSRRA